jgi:hypothetical protein
VDASSFMFSVYSISAKGCSGSSSKPEWLFKGSFKMKIASQWMLQFSVVLVPKKVVPGLIYQSRNGYSNSLF